MSTPIVTHGRGPWLAAARAGILRGLIELRQAFTNTQQLMGVLMPNVIMVVVMFFLRGKAIPGVGLSVGSMAMPSVLGMNIAFVGLMGVASSLMTERGDGTLLRAKAIPNGMVGFLVGKIVSGMGMTVLGMLVILIPAVILFDGVGTGGPVGWLTLVWVLVLGMVATMPIGAIVGSLFEDPRNLGLVMMPIMGLVAISGIFYPITALPHWLQWIAQVFPVYWLGLGMRSALLAPGLAATEIGGSWRHLQTLVVLVIWSIAGLVIAPLVLRRMARRESGSTLSARQEIRAQRMRGA